MMLKAWISVSEVPYCFSMSSVNLQGHAEQKITDFDPIYTLSDCNSSLNSHMATKLHTKLDVARERCPIVFQGHLSNFKVTQLTKIVDFDTNWAFPDCNSSLNSPMVMKWCTKPEEAEGCPIFFQCHLSNFQVTRDKKILTQIGVFRTVTPCWIRRWPWNDVQSLK